ncbi:hypothetical protein DL766_010352 [Monosporascus sp. MC13-8B]|uniref:Opsin-1 n=1 Tax=Monosporascus cannonballus TaxID=155416 RepID=A0ABY0HJM0_9PEZI|nr:hypothetical protein DL763_004728 [Monosporascus cannonballus]RYO94006.1 hypothetical protein DL762_000754 [Monosporascus cannonballus]RYP02454.1 hypothetical protein DL766_010352 [Monosporascus sp. MC13-8B]
MIVPQDFLEEATILPPPPPTATMTATPTSLPTVKPDPSPLVFSQSATETGHRTLWVVCALMGFASLVFYYLASRVPVQKRLFHFITSLITTIAFLSYFAMATGDGVALRTVSTKENSSHTVIEITQRQIYWARYVDWSLTTPLLLLDLALLAGLSGYSILVTISADVIMVLTGLFASFSDFKAQKWGWYAIGCLAYLTIIYQLAYKGRQAVANKDNRTRSFFGAISLFFLILWTVYPIVWGFSQGARIASVDGEIIAYAVLDLLAKPVFGLWLLLSHDSNVVRSTPSLDGFWSEGLLSEGSIRVGEERAHDDD